MSMNLEEGSLPSVHNQIHGLHIIMLRIQNHNNLPWLLTDSYTKPKAISVHLRWQCKKKFSWVCYLLTLGRNLPFYGDELQFRRRAVTTAFVPKMA